MKRLSLASKVRSQRSSFDPFSVLHMDPRKVDGGPMSDPQRKELAKAGVPDDEIAKMSGTDAQRLIRAVMARRQRGLATIKQLNVLRRFGIHEVNVRMSTASILLDFIANSRWDSRVATPEVLSRMMIQQRGR